MRPVLFDAHLDLACLAVVGRDMLAPAEDLSAEGPHAVGAWPPASITLPSLTRGGVRFVLATIFTEAGGGGPEGYPVGDVERAYKAGRAQLEVYLTWQDMGLIALDLARVLRDDPGVGEVRGGMGVAEPSPFSLESKLARLPLNPAIHAGVLIENADPIRSPEELAWWVERGVVAVGLAWWRSSRYASGNGAERSERVGLTEPGREMVRAMDALGVVHDQSHLSDRATMALFEATDRPVMASHSNCRVLLGGDENPAWQRHLTDEMIREIVSRGGVIGLNLVRRFIRYPLDERERPSIEDAVAHVEHICSIAGHTRCVGLGTDMDGGISAEDLPEGIDRPTDLMKILDALRSRGWSDEDVAAFAYGNWMRFWREASNESARRRRGARADQRAGD